VITVVQQTQQRSRWPVRRILRHRELGWKMLDESVAAVSAEPRIRSMAESCFTDSYP
jgi:hypothetical protein